jgi:hypothetical protein
MFSDLEMIKALRPTQIATMKMMYAPLVKQLNLSPEQADKFYDTIVDSGIKSVQAMQAGNLKPDDMKATKQSLESDLQTLLGDDGFAQYQNYSKNDMPAQTQLAALRNDFANEPLNDTQQQQLLQAMKSARQSVTANNPADLSQANPSDITANITKAADQQEQINQIVLQQASAFLSPSQLQTLSTSQSNMVSMQKSMAPMMQKMMGNAPANP